MPTTTVTSDELRAQLDADRGQDAWNDGPKLTLRQLFCFAGAWASDGPAWLWWRTRSYNDLRGIRAGAWDANLLDREAAARWEIARRDAGVSDATVAQWLGIELRGGIPSDPGSPTPLDVERMLLGAGCDPVVLGHRLVRGVHHVRVRVQSAHRFGPLEQHPETAGEGATLEAAIENALAHLAERTRAARAE